MHAWRILSSPQRNKAFVRESGLEMVQGATRGGGASRPGVCGEAAGVAVNGSKHRRDIRVSVTHARSPGWSAGQCTGGDILDNGGSAAQGLLAKKLPER